jgi:hypothetical protein
MAASLALGMRVVHQVHPIVLAVLGHGQQVQAG